MSSAYTNPLPGGIPDTHREHTESRTTILLPKDHSAFLNPPQQFNRDLSVAVIRAWNERRIEVAETAWKAKQAKKGKNKAAVEGSAPTPVAGPSNEGNSRFQVRNIRILEALSATGLRSIRYAKEIPNVK
jgi:tRNA (guanine26-N2/guanine27-N2)-dimethyltransferase